MGTSNDDATPSTSPRRYDATALTRGVAYSVATYRRSVVKKSRRFMTAESLPSPAPARGAPRAPRGRARALGVGKNRGRGGRAGGGGIPPPQQHARQLELPGRRRCART